MKAPLLPALLLAALAATAVAADVTKTHQWRYVDVSLDPADQGATTTLYCMHPDLEGRTNPIAAAVGGHPAVRTDCYYWKRVNPEKLVPAGGGRACEREAVLFGQLAIDGANLKLKAGAKTFSAKQRFNALPECRGGDYFSVTKTADATESLSGGSTKLPGLAAGGLHSHFLVFRYGRNNNPYQVVLVPRIPVLPPEGTVPAYVIKTLQHDNGTRYSGLLEPFTGTVSLLAEPGARNRSATLTDGGKTYGVRACTINERCIETIPTGSSLYIAYSVAFAYLDRSTPVVTRRAPIPDSAWEEKITPLLHWSKVKGTAVATAPLTLMAPAMPLSPAPTGLLAGDFWCYHPDLDGKKTLTQLVMRDNGPQSLTCVDWSVVGDGMPKTEGGNRYLTRRYTKKVSVSVNSGKLMLGIKPYLPVEADETPNRPLTGPRATHVKVTARGEVAPPTADHPGKVDNRNTLDWTLFGEDKVDVAGKPWKERERDWLSAAEHKSYKSACAKPQDTPACRTATSAARAKISANMRTMKMGGIPKSYKLYYDEGIAKRGDARATALVTILSLLSTEKYGSNNRADEVSLNAAELARLAAAPKGAVTAAKTGKALHDEYKTALAALPADDHVGRWQLTKKYRPEVPAAAPAPVVNQPAPPLSTAGLTPDELARLRLHAPDLASSYESSLRSTSEPLRVEALRRARQWLADHPMPEDFARLDEAGMRRICAKMKEENAVPAAAVPTAEPDPNAGALDELGMRHEELHKGDNTRTRVMDGAVPPARTRTRYQWPADIVAKCAQLEQVVRRPPADPAPGPVAANPAPNVNANLTGTGLPTPDAKKEGAKEPLTAWNPLLNGAKGAILGAIVGFTLGGPLGLLIGAAVFGGAAWGLSKVG